jgi:uncharacterized protein (UPF0276 family)
MTYKKDMDFSNKFNPVPQDSSFSSTSASTTEVVSPPLIASSACGIGLKPSFFDEILADKYEGEFTLDFFEVHTENYMADGGIDLYKLDQINERYPISLHGVGMSLGSVDGLNMEHLARTKNVMDRINPVFISDHISFSVTKGSYLNDLMPLPYTEESLAVMVQNIKQMQDFLGRKMLVENPSSYLLFKNSEMSEPEFLNEIISQTGCGLLLDVNNVYVSCYNHGWDAEKYIKAVNAEAVEEYHIAGHSENIWKDDQGRVKTILIDDHGSNICDGVWQLYKYTLGIIGERPNLIEWDTNIPSYYTLLQESGRAKNHMEIAQMAHKIKIGSYNE